MALRLEDIIDIEQFQMLQDRLNEIYSFPSAIIDNDGNILTATAWQDVCTKFHRKNPECEAECIKSDQYIISHLHEADPAVSYRCPHGLVDNATPIIIEGVHYGNFFTGQFFLEPPDIEFFRKQAARYGFSEDAYIEAVRKVPVWSQEQLENYLYFIKGMIEVISAIGLKRLKEIEISKELFEAGEFNRQVIQSAQDGIVVYDTDMRYRVWNPKMEEISEVSAAGVIGKKPQEMFPFLEDAGVVERLENALRGEIQKQIEFPYKLKSGKIGWTSDTTGPLRNADGAIIGAIGIVRDVTDQKKAEEALMKSEEQNRFLASIVERSSQPFAVGYPDGSLGKVNKAFCDFVGYDEEELLNIDWNQDLTPEEWREKERELVAEVIRTEEPSRYEKEYIRKDGTRVSAELLVSVEKDKDGEVLLLYGFVTDITERKKAEEALKNSESHIRLITDTSPAFIAYVSADDLCYRFVNQRFVEAFGFSKEEFYGKHISEVIGESNTEFAMKYIDEARRGNPASYENHFNTEQGERYVKVNYVPDIDENGVVKGLVVMSHDITENKRTDDALRATQEAGGLGTYILSFATGKWTGSDVLKELLGVDDTFDYSVEGWGALIHPEQREMMLKYLSEEVAGKKGVFDKEYKIVRKNDGAVRWVHGLGKLEFDHEGRPVKMSGTIMDVTERKKVEEAQLKLLEQENYATVGRVAGKMAHDFNNVLGIIMGTSQILQSDGLPEEINAEIEIILESARRGKDLTRNLLIFAQDQETNLVRFDLSEKISMLVKSLRHDLKGILVEVNYGSGVRDLVADAGLLENALINLIQNSIHAMSRTENPRLKISAFMDGDETCIEIEDNGCGIPEEYKDKIFEPTVTLKGSGDRYGSYRNDIRGSGYGLANVKRCVDKHGWRIEFESEEGRGSKFKMICRRLTADLSAGEVDAIKDRKTVAGKRILVVEDEPQFGRILCALLSKFDHIVDLAADGKSAAALAAENKYDAISLDFILPDMNGMEVYRRIRETDREVPVIFVSGNFEFMQSMIDLKKEDPMVDHLAKPFGNLDYINKIHDCFE